MVPRRYTTKVRAKRIEIEYFKRVHPFRRWKLILAIATPLVAGAWLVGAAVRGDQRIYTSGAVSTAHAMFGTRCSDCHVPTPPPGTAQAVGAPPTVTGRSYFLRPTDPACLACHDGPIHHEQQTFTPGCASCHVEHKGRVQLTAVRDRQCVQCHTDLRIKDGTAPHYAARIAGFASGHPEFAVDVKDKGRVLRVRLDQKAELKDHAQIKLNHQKHVKVGLKGLEELRALRGTRGIAQRKEGLQLTCGFCHQTDESGIFMQPVSYAKHCGPGCHPLDVDARLPDAVAPHDRPAIVHAYMRTLFLEAYEHCEALPKAPAGKTPDGGKLRAQCQELELISAPPAEEPADRPRGGRRGASEPESEPAAERPRGARLGRSEPVEQAEAESPRGGRLLRREAAEEPPADRPRGLRGRSEAPAETATAATASGGSALEWASAQLDAAEKTMIKQKCLFCHTVTLAPDRLPEVAPTAIPVRWLPHSRFDHGVHRPISCTECHRATTSQETADVLLPPAKTCRECHRESGGARAGCVECHRYHDKTKERERGGPFTVRKLTAESSAAGAWGHGVLQWLLPGSSQ